MAESADSVELRIVPLLRPQRKDVRLELEFTRGRLPKQDDQIMLMAVGWKALNECISSIRTNGSSTITFIPDGDFFPGEPEQTFQFLYIQDNRIFGTSYPFTPGADEPEQEVSGGADQEMLSWTDARARGRHSDTDGRLPLEVRDELCPLLTEGKADDKTGESTGTCTASSASLQDGADANLWRSKLTNLSDVLPTEIGHLADEISSIKKQNSESVDSFVVVAVPSGKASSGCLESEPTLLSSALRERDRVAKMYEREKTIEIKQEKKNEELQTACDEVEEENRKLKKALLEVESQIRLLQAKKARESMGDHPLASSRTVPLYRETLASASYIRRGEGSGNQKAFFGKNEGDSTLTLKKQVAVSERSSLFSSVAEVLSCPLCSETFDKLQGATQFQRHVYSHFI